MSNELIPIIVKEDGIQAVDGRTLHAFLEIKTRYNDWASRRIAEYDFTEGIDFYLTQNRVRTESSGCVDTELNHIFTLDAAKELSMVEKNEKGKQARKYFIEVEKKYKAAAPKTYIESLKALLASEEAKEKLRLENEANKKLIEQKDAAIEHKEDVIIGLVKDISLTEKRQRLDQIMKYNFVSGEQMSKRWTLLYSEFEKKFHCDVGTRIKNSGNKMSKINYIDKVMNMIPELYELACKIFENDLKTLKEEWFDSF